jgi:hypothetical protein
MATLQLSDGDLKPLIREIVEAVFEQANELKQLMNGKLCITEPEAANLLGLNTWQLRDVRLSGKITYSRIVGNKVRYTLDDLVGYLRRGRDEGNGT